MKAKHYSLLLIAVALINTQIEGMANIAIQLVICILLALWAAKMDKEAQKKKQ